MQEDRVRGFLGDLGKSTMRGIRRCPKCGTFNGTRGLSCKNKSCNAVFKEAGIKKKTLDVVKLQTGTSTQIFSVRVWDKGPDYRGFVQLPQAEQNIVSALCFVDSCQRLFNMNILKCHERQAMQVTHCSHVQLAMRCCNNAQILRIENEAIQSPSIPAEMKESIYELANEMPGPLVQRISKNTMAVKCKVTTKHPLGYLHVTFFICNKSKESQYVCHCTPLKSPGKSNVDKPCVHYFACIAAFLSDEKYTEEFSAYIVREKPIETFTIEISHEGGEVDERNPLVTILGNTINQDDCEEVKDLLLPDIAQDLERLTSVDVGQDFESLDQHTLESMIKVGDEKKSKPSRKRRSIHKTAPLKKRNRKGLPKEMLIEEHIDESKVSLSFLEWLASVTERINQTMHYQFSGKPEPLVFHAPHEFFECLISRFVSTSINSKRKRLPNFVTTFTRKNATPLGTFHNYTWHITNMLHAKAMFDTPLMSLNSQRTFVQNSAGSYDELNQKDIVEGLPRMEGQSAIRPTEYKTFLKIGNMSPDQSEPSILSIDWTPNVLPLSKIGELKITLEYGHSKHPP
ncbi:uncharacterized protein C2orf42 homolog isoform X2 [Cimex lectularius]|uniref:Putative treble-clef zinc-finger domain-containing protein n=1 Tax=Cimex lectularius TaxID=79782 RepID=A0A8I6S7T0_CIMLE|nr:uncharacterized protein C2orf42 homolog isoform X2 [Cimex lectularius]